MNEGMSALEKNQTCKIADKPQDKNTARWRRV